MTTDDVQQLDVFLAAYQQYVREVLKPSQTEVMRYLGERQQPSYWSRHRQRIGVPIPSPIHSATSRIKRPEQVVDKILRKPDAFPGGLRGYSFRAMDDALGVRVVVYFLSHLTLIDREIHDSQELEVSRDEPPVAYMSANATRVLSLDHLDQSEKESGYSSVHYTVRLRRSSVPEPDRPWFELQVRTLAQELWSEIEHHLGYKPGKAVSIAARRQLQILSLQLSAIDEHFNFLYEELNRFQQEVSYGGTDPLNVENLPSVLGEIGMACAQRDINNIIKFLYSRGVETVNDLRRLATPRRLDMIRNTFLSVTGRSPVSLEVVATLAAISGAESEAVETKRIRSQIAYRGAWDEIRSEPSREET